MFSSISNKYEENLKDELFGCFKHIGIPFDILDRMPIRDRKFYINRHNKMIEEEEMKRNNSSGQGRTNDIDRYTDLDQSNLRNRGNE